VKSREKILQIFVLPFCFGCETAMTMADRLREHQLAGVTVQVIDLSEPGAVRPDSVFAVPTYLLDGRVVSLGNPEEPWLIERILRVGEK
jgi:predicted thioredoxin/glutaredoxin